MNFYKVILWGIVFCSGSLSYGSSYHNPADLARRGIIMANLFDPPKKRSPLHDFDRSMEQQAHLAELRAEIEAEPQEVQKFSIVTQELEKLSENLEASSFDDRLHWRLYIDAVEKLRDQLIPNWLTLVPMGATSAEIQLAELAQKQLQVNRTPFTDLEDLESHAKIRELTRLCVISRYHSQALDLLDKERLIENKLLDLPLDIPFKSSEDIERLSLDLLLVRQRQGLNRILLDEELDKIGNE